MMARRMAFVGLVFLSLAACAPSGARTGTTATDAPPAPVTATPWPTPPIRRPIYIVDPNDQGPVSRILVVDPDQLRIAFTLTTRYLPEIALSADGRRLYVADSYRTQVIRGETQDVLSVYDALSGELLLDDTPIQGRLLYKGLPLGEPFLFLSDNGRQLYVMKYGDPDTHQTRLTVLDPATLQTVREGDWPPCGDRIRVQADRWLCANGAALDVVDPSSRAVVETLLKVPSGQTVAWLITADGERLYVLYADATLAVANLQDRKIVTARRLEVNEHWLPVWDGATLSPDGRRLYVGFDTGEGESAVFSDAIAVYDTATWANIATIKLGDTMWHFALSAEGDQLYAVSPAAHDLRIYDTTTFQEVATLPNLGGTPARIVVPRERH